MGVSDREVRRRLNPLVFCGAISVNKDKKPYEYQVAKEELVVLTDLGLPEPEELTERIAIKCT